MIPGIGQSQMFASAKLSGKPGWVKPEGYWKRGTDSGGSKTSDLRRQADLRYCVLTSTSPTARCGPACRVVWEGIGQVS